MKIVVTSDIHLGITTEDELKSIIEEISCLEPDVLIAAGDLGEFGGYFVRCLEILNEISVEHKLALVGNHDLWTRIPDMTSKKIWEEVLPDFVRELGWVWLEEETVKLGRTGLVGSIAWYDYEDASDYGITPNESIRLRKGYYNNDDKYMDKSWNDIEFSTARSAELMRRISVLDKDEEIDNIIVVTHVPVFGVQRVQHHGDDPLANGYFYNLSLGRQLMEVEKLRTVISGHTHRGMEELVQRGKLPEIRAVVVPAEYHNPGFVELEIEKEEEDDTR